MSGRNYYSTAYALLYRPEFFRLQDDDMKGNKCKYPPCDRTAQARGLCKSCWFMARKLVLGGLISWAQLEETGRADPPYKGSKTSDRRAWFLGYRDAEAYRDAVAGIDADLTPKTR